MRLSWKTRRRLSLLILVVGMPVYIVVAVTVVNWLDRPGIWVELAVYAILGVLWALPFRSVFQGVGRADPQAASDEGRP